MRKCLELVAAVLLVATGASALVATRRSTHVGLAPRWGVLVRSGGKKTEPITIAPIARCAGEVALPGSKSLSNRALLLAALATGTTTVENLLASDDT